MRPYTYPQKVKILPSTWEELKKIGNGDGSLGAQILLSGDKPEYDSKRTKDEWLVLRKAQAKQRIIVITPAQCKTIKRWAKEDGVTYRGEGNMSLYLDILLS